MCWCLFPSCESFHPNSPTISNLPYIALSNIGNSTGSKTMETNYSQVSDWSEVNLFAKLTNQKSVVEQRVLF